MGVAAAAQTIVAPGQLSTVLAQFDAHQGGQPLRCEVAPTAPSLNFAFRFQARYAYHVPSTAYQGSNHTWYALTKITPAGGDRQPVYLYARSRPADIVNAGPGFEVHGSFLLGEGSYAIKGTLLDDQDRTCKREWRVEVKRSRNERAVRPALAPFTVQDFTSHSSAAVVPRSPATRRLSILLDAAPLSQRRLTLRPSDRQLLLGALAGLMERVAARSVRLVVFSLEQQKELLREDSFTLDSLDRVSRAMESLDLASVNVSVLQNPRGGVDLLTGLVNRELLTTEPSDAVLFLGPLSRYHEKIGEDGLQTGSQAPPRFFYFQYQPPPRRPPPDQDAAPEEEMPPPPKMPPPQNTTSTAQGVPGGRTGDSTGQAPSGKASSGRGTHTMSAPPLAPSLLSDTDIINSAVAKLKGKTLVIHTPAEFARAIEQLDRHR